jgi:nucleoside-triphosphatase THEP1
VKNFRKAILVTGTPGVGKTTISHKLASKLDALYIGITELVKKQKLITSVDEERKTLIADTEKVSKQLQEILAKAEGSIIIEGHYAVDVVPKKDVNTVFVLRRDPRELKGALVVEEMMLVLEKRKDCRFGIVDWLGKLENDGQLGEFLRKFRLSQQP